MIYLNFPSSIDTDIDFFNVNDRIPIRISLNLFPRSSIDSKLAVVQVMAWCRIGGKPLSEPMLTQFTDAYMRH